MKIKLKNKDGQKKKKQNQKQKKQKKKENGTNDNSVVSSKTSKRVLQKTQMVCGNFYSPSNEMN